MQVATLSVFVDAMSRQGAGNLAVTLVPASGGELPAFRAGAHVDVHLRDGLVRQYSIASSPNDRNSYLLCVRRASLSRGGSEHVHASIRVGDVLQISNPRNLFELQPAANHVLVAGGIGITPLLSMAHALDEAGTPFELHYYVASASDVAFARRLAQGFTHGHVRIYSDEEGKGPQACPPQTVLKPPTDSRLYLCGPGGFMDFITDTALRNGWPQERIHREEFGPASNNSTPESGSTSGVTDSFEVRLTSSGRSFMVQPHQSIADVLLDAGVNVPISCGMGICGACLTTVVSGEVDHRDSVQSDGEKCAASQSIALCCSRSRSPLLVIDL